MGSETQVLILQQTNLCSELSAEQYTQLTMQKRQSLAKVTLKVKDTAKDGVQNISSLETFNGADSPLGFGFKHFKSLREAR